MLQILLLCLVAFHTSQATHAEKATVEEVLRTLDAIDHVLGWARAHYDSLILDFIFGLRIAQGELEVLVDRPSSGWGDTVIFRLQYLHQKVTNLVDLTMGTIAVTKDPYYENMKRIISQGYSFTSIYPKDRTFTLPKKQAAPKRARTFNETQSDNCMLEILGTPEVKACTISMACFRQMTNDHSEEYQLTHQLLYFMLGEIRGCGGELKVLAQWMGLSIQDKMEQYTIKMYQRMKSIFDNGSFDLFSEMVMVGQMLNYDHFYSAPITELLLLWQHPSGCYVDEDMLPNEVLDKTDIVGRKLLADEIIDGSCSQHFTAVCTAVLSLILQHQLTSLSKPFPHIEPWLLLIISVTVLLLFAVFVKHRRFKLLRRFF